MEKIELPRSDLVLLYKLAGYENEGWALTVGETLSHAKAAQILSFWAQFHIGQGVMHGKLRGYIDVKETPEGWNEACRRVRDVQVRVIRALNDASVYQRDIYYT